MNTITQTTRQMSFDDIQDKAKIRYIQILNRLDKPKTAKELAVELFDLGFIPSTERNYTAPRLSELADMGMVKAIDKKKCEYTGKTVAVYEGIWSPKYESYFKNLLGEWYELSTINSVSVQKHWNMDYVDGCQQLENIYFRGVKQCKYVTNNQGKQIELNLKGELRWNLKTC